MCKVKPYYYVKLEIYFQNMTPSFNLLSISQKKFLENFVELLMFVKIKYYGLFNDYIFGNDGSHIRWGYFG